MLASVILQKRIMAVADKHYEKPVLGPICQWIEVGVAVHVCFLWSFCAIPTLEIVLIYNLWQAVPLCFVSIILAASTNSAVGHQDFQGSHRSLATVGYGDADSMDERIVRWRLRLQFFAYETLGDLRITELFDVIVDYPER